jgi:hypothetical protein
MIQIYKNGMVDQQKSFGYYTNGRSLNRKIIIEIEPDTMKIVMK